MNNQEKYKTFRGQFPVFVYDSFHYDVQPDGLHIAFRFFVGDDVVFEPTAFFPSRPFLHPQNLTKQTLDTLVFHIGMIELISYWKAFCPPTVVIKPFRLTDKQMSFWKKLYFNGLGEFFYTNGIDATEDDFLTIDTSCCICGDTAPFTIHHSQLTIHNSRAHIVPIGGGKDSVVTLELLDDCLPLIMNPRGATVECVRKAGFTLDDVIVIKRTIDSRLLEANKEGALNGHTPFSAMLAFYTLLASALTGSRFRIALSNENSANESTVAGTKVNHQYSKSLEFENDFRGYVAEYISSEFNYYSFLRPLSELQIAMLFARQPKYFDVFKSCNVGSKEDIWCGHCAKCLFAYIILSPFIEPERLDAIFGKNMLDDESLRLEFDQLTGHAETKPFECVGTVSEVNSALSMTLSKWYAGKDRVALPSLLRDYVALPPSTPLYTLFTEHNVPADDLSKLMAATVSPQLQNRLYRQERLVELLKGKRILIAGYGREGKSCHALLQRLFPMEASVSSQMQDPFPTGTSPKFDIASNNEEIIAALQDNKYDMILKSPGIPTFVFESRCDLNIISSLTDIFLQVYGDQTIGITGTKGKSTTTSLIYHVLKSAGKDVVLAGNIGIPLFDIIPCIKESTIVVAELSCHQLENIHRGPHTALLLNLYQEHLDHYHDYNDYMMAKMQITLKQHDGDVFYYCADNDDLNRCMHLCTSRCNVIGYTLQQAQNDEALSLANSPLQGDHNLSNCYVAMFVCKQYGVSEQQFVAALEKFEGLEHRLEYVATVHGVKFYDDSISTIPQTTIAAIQALKDVDTLILGGFDRGIDYKPLADFLANNPLGQAVRNLVLLGSAGKSIYDAIVSNCGDSVSPFHKGTSCRNSYNLLTDYSNGYKMDEAVAFALKHTCKGRICLLSPAASSYDHYKNFEERGKHYKDCVKQYS